MRRLLTVTATLLAWPAFSQETAAPGSAEPTKQGQAASQPPAEGQPEIDLRTLESWEKEFSDMGDSVSKEVDSLLLREIGLRKTAVERDYKREASSIEEELRQRRKEAISQFEQFLSRHPTNKKYTPEVMFRLAELYHDDAQDQYLLAMPQYSEQHALWERGKIADEPKQPFRDYSKSVEIYELLLQRFPDYVNADAAYYAMGYCLIGMADSLAEQDRLEEAQVLRKRGIAAFREMIEKHPRSRWVSEAWLLVGESLFESGAYKEAVEAYTHAMADESSRYYDMALYKMAWAYFQSNDYPSAIRTFKKLIERVDSKKAEGGLGPMLRQEAVEYLGISLADDDWNGDGEPDPDATVARAVSFMSEGKPFEREVLEKYADTLYSAHEIKKYPMAIEAYRAVIAKDPMHPGNAVVKEKIVGVYDLLNDKERMIAERQDMVAQFGPGSAWYKANEGRPEVLARVDRQLELALAQAAQFHHQRAQGLRRQFEQMRDKPEGKQFGEAMLAEYKKAASIYEEYLRRFPTTRYAYDNAFYYAECLYSSLDFEKAYEAYRRVRDWPNRTTYREQAAYGMSLALEKEAAKRVAEGRLAQADVPGDVSEVVTEEKGPQGEEKVKLTPLPIPPLTEEWIKSVDYYIENNLCPPGLQERVPKLEYRVAAELYKRRHMDDARKRFERILQKYPTSTLAASAAVSIINSFRLENDWDSIAEWSKKIEELKVGKPEERAALAQEVKLFQLGAQFKGAEAAFEAKDYKRAAEAFLAVVDSDPKNKVADKALQNAAVAYMYLKWYDSAAKVYQRLVAEYPSSPFVEGALYQLAENARKFLDFERAIEGYKALIARFPKTEKLQEATFKIAQLTEALGRVREAARAHEKYVESYPSDPEAPALLFRVAGLYEKLGDQDEAVRIYRLFVSRYGMAVEQNDRVMDALAKIADIYRAQGRMKEWETVARQVIKEFHARGMEPGTRAAGYAAKAQFLLIEDKFRQYEAIQFRGDLKTQGKLIKQKQALMAELEQEYAAVLPYNSVEWSSAAVYRMAALPELFAKAMFAAEIPPMDPEQEDIYRTQLEDVANQYRMAAQDRYVKIIEENRRLKTRNEWTDKALEAMNKYRPHEFPLLKNDRRILERSTRYAAPQFEEAL